MIYYRHGLMEVEIKYLFYFLSSNPKKIAKRYENEHKLEDKFQFSEDRGQSSKIEDSSLKIQADSHPNNTNVKLKQNYA